MHLKLFLPQASRLTNELRGVSKSTPQSLVNGLRYRFGVIFGDIIPIDQIFDESL
jgi:hypothetical protein